MAFDANTALLRLWNGGAINTWVLDTEDNVAAATATDYIPNAAPATTAGSEANASRGMKVGDPVYIRVVDDVSLVGSDTAAHTDHAWAFVSALDADGNATLTLAHTNA